MHHRVLARARLLAGYFFILIIPILYLIIDQTHYNNDDNFSQFTPVFSYAYDALFKGYFPWLSPVDYTVRLAQAPYYAIFSPIMLLSAGITHILTLAPYWIINFWVLIHLLLINLVIIHFARTLSISEPLRIALVLSAGTATFMAQMAVNWYYTLPYQLLLIVKIIYWYGAISNNGLNRQQNALQHFLAIWFATLGGNPQLLTYTLIVEFMFLIPQFNLKLIKIWARYSIYTLVLLTPSIYNHLRYWNNAHRIVDNNHKIEVATFFTKVFGQQIQKELHFGSFFVLLPQRYGLSRIDGCLRKKW